MAKEPLQIVGELMGIRTGGKGTPVGEVVRILHEMRPVGPGENSIVIVERNSDNQKRARYLSWIGYADLDEASAAEPGVWKLIEPPIQYKSPVLWVPFADSES